MSILSFPVLWTFIRRNLAKIFLHENWMIGWIDQPIENAIHWKTCPPIHWMGQHSDKRYLADPFAWPGQKDIILCENYDFQTRLGTLHMLNIKGGAILSEREIALPLLGHLSFPFMFKNGENIFLIPESCAARRVTIFQWHLKEQAWREFATPLSDTAAADSVLFEHEGYFWLAYTNTDLSPFDNLNLCYAPTLQGPWLKHQGNPVKRDLRTARCGGTPFRVGEKFYRPAQDCSETYGGAIIIMEIVECSPSIFREKEVTLIAAQRDGMNPHGLHTLAAWGNKCLVDGKRMMFSPSFFVKRLGRFIKKSFLF